MKEVFEPSINLSGQFFEPLDFNSRYSNFSKLGDFLKSVTPEQVTNVGNLAKAGYDTVQTIRGLGSNPNQNQEQQLQQQLQQQQALSQQQANAQQLANAQQQATLNEQLRIQQQNNLRLQSGAREPEKKSNKNLIIGLSIGGGVLLLTTVLILVLRKKK